MHIYRCALALLNEKNFNLTVIMEEQLKKWRTKTFRLDELIDHPRNPRQLDKHNHKYLKESLEKFGLIDRPVCTKEGLIIGGHQRVKILKEMKYEFVECLVPEKELSFEEIDRLCIGLNRNTGDWDMDSLANEWELDELLNAGMLESDLALPTIEEIKSEDEEDAKGLNIDESKEAITKPGDVWELGPHRLICGDSTLPETVEKLLGGNEPILMVTDPPYGVNYDPEWRSRSIPLKSSRAVGKVKNDDKANWALAWHLFPGSVAYVWHASLYGNEVMRSLQEAEFELLYQIIWNKQHFAIGRGDYHWKHESCIYACKKGHKHNWQGSRKEHTVWEIGSLNAYGKSQDEDKRTAHSTQKPIECMSKPIINNSAKGEQVYDPFLGSGTTLIAAESLGRICFGVELSPHYCDIIVQRYINYKKKNNEEYTIKRNGKEEDWPTKD